jgi:hypothetical protein
MPSWPVGCDDVAVLHLELALEDVGVGLVADGDEAALQRQILGGAPLCAAQAHAGDPAVVAQHFVQRVPQVQFDLAGRDLGVDLVHHDGLGAELVAAVHQVHFGGDVGQVQRFFNRRIAAAHHAHRVAAVEEAVAGGATAHALAHEGLLRWASPGTWRWRRWR